MVKQYDVFRHRSSKGRGAVKYLIVLQCGDFSALQSTIVAPLRKQDDRLLSKLNIPIQVNSERLYISMPEMGMFSVNQFGKFEINAENVHEQVMKAIDLLFAGI